ncbi:MAG: DUF799 domain-containing protein [Elusimicrobia bacterium]|nr:DUF799 domain-containing protein [Candidatus Obscuribacterium magneticum]
MAFPGKINVSFSLLILALGSCTYGPRPFLKKGYLPPKRIAVLPLDNHTNDLDGPDIVRYWFNQRLAEKKGYQTVTLSDIDGKLKGLGFAEGGQLSALPVQQLGPLLGADAVIYGDLLDFNYQTTGFLNIRKVRAAFKMVDSASGETLWQAEGLGANSEGGLSSKAALQMGLKSLGTQLAEKAMSSPLKTETWDMIWNAIEDLPKAR